MKKAQVQVEVAQDDVDDVVEIATRMMMEDEGKMTLEEVQAVGAELDIPPEYIARAQAQLVKERQQRALQIQTKEERQSTIAARIAVGITSVGTIILLWVGLTASSLGKLHATALSSLAQMESVTQRRDAVVELYKGQPDSPDKNAELIGAENRIRVETKRFNEAAAAYNAKARGLPGSIARAVNGLPAEIPASP